MIGVLKAVFAFECKDDIRNHYDYNDDHAPIVEPTHVISVCRANDQFIKCALLFFFAAFVVDNLKRCFVYDGNSLFLCNRNHLRKRRF